MKRIEFPLELYLDIDYEYEPETRQNFDHAHGNWLPGVHASIKIVNVWLGNGENRINVIEQIRTEYLEYLEAQLMARQEEL